MEHPKPKVPTIYKAKGFFHLIYFNFMDNDLIEYLEKRIKEINDLRNVKNQSKENWIKHILTLLTGLLSILIAFDCKEVLSDSNHLLFSCTLISTGLSIFLGVVYLHHTIDLLSRTIKFDMESLTKRLHGDNDLHSKVIKPHRAYTIVRYLFYISALASLVLLIWYGITKNMTIFS